MSFFSVFFIQLLCEKLTVFLYGQYIVGNVCWLSENVVNFEIKVWVYENLQKCNSDFTKKSWQAVDDGVAIFTLFCTV